MRQRMQHQMGAYNQLAWMEQGNIDQNFNFLFFWPTAIYFGFSSRGSKRSVTSLSVVSVQATDIPPKETVTYTKQTQTASTGGVERDGG